MYAGRGADIVFGGRGLDLIYGNFENDLIYGNFEDDTLLGGQGADQIYGGQGDDVLIGNAGEDILLGNLGADTFVFGAASGFDTVIRFNSDEGDRLDVQGQTYAVQDTAEGLELDLSGGGTILLKGVHEFSSGFFV